MQKIKYGSLLRSATGLAGFMLLAGCGQQQSNSSHNDPPEILNNSLGETVVQASGNQQSGDSGQIENDCVVSEPYMVGTTASAGIFTVRHGFTPPQSSGEQAPIIIVNN